IFDIKNTKVIGYGDLLEEIQIKDEPYPQLIVLVKPEINEEEVRNIILMKGKEGRRIYRNTIVVVCPHQQTDFKTILFFAAKIEAAEEVKRSLAEYYTDKDIRNLQKKKLEDYIQDNIRLLNEHLLSALTRIAYPVREAEKDEIKWTITSAASSIIPQVEAGLKNPGTGPKLRIDISFEDLSEFLKMNQNWDLIEGTNRYTFKEILNTFYTVTSAPLTTRYAIEQAIRNGLETFNIGIMMDGKLYWKRIGPENGIESPSKIKDEAEILPYKVAAKILKDTLLEESGLKKIGEEMHEVWYEIEIADKKIKLEDLIHQKDWEKIVKNGIILKNERIIATGFILTLEPSVISIKPNEQVKTKVKITPIEKYDFSIKIEVDKGVINPNKGRAPFEAIWDLGTLKEIGEHKFKIKAIGEDGTELVSILTIIVESLEEEIRIENLDLTYVGAKLTQIIPKDLTSLQMVTEMISKLNLEAILPQLLIKFEENIIFTGKDLNSKIVGYLAQKLRDIKMSLKLKETEFVGIVTLKNPIIIDSSKIAAFIPLSGKASFILKVMKK
ncbi:MAG: DUF499 domain-containing protein, partial [Candidatus Methanomethylicaceae archaeon]